MLTFVFVTVAALVTMLAVYFTAHRLFPSWGTIITNAFAALAMLLDVAGALPWGTILDAKTAAAIGFAMAVGNGIMRTVGGGKSPVGSGK